MSKVKLHYDDDQQLFKCVCGGFHYFEVSRDEFNGEYNYWVTFVEHPKSLRQRLNAFRAVFTGQTVYHGELNLQDVKRLREVLSPKNAPKSKPPINNKKGANNND